MIVQGIGAKIVVGLHFPGCLLLLAYINKPPRNVVVTG